MLDYYSSIPMTNKDIKASILHHLSEYPEDYVVKLSEKLGVYETTYYVTGWNVFQGPEWVKKMQDILCCSAFPLSFSSSNLALRMIGGRI